MTASAHAFHLEITDDRVAILTFDLPGRSANVFNEKTLLELDARLARIEREPDLAGLIIRSGKPAIFIAGADLDALAGATLDELGDLITLGQNVFSRLASFVIPTTAAINGSCLGGGCELALACDWRVATDAPKTRIGLPETRLGIIPAWGGTTRLPKLLGLPAALPLLLSGKVLNSPTARHKGLVDEVVPPQCLVDQAHTLLARGKRKLPRRLLLHSLPAVAFIRHRARADLRARTRGHYPAPFKALEVASRSVSTTEFLSLRNEREAILDLARRPETKHLQRLFHLSEHARKLTIPRTRPRDVQRVAVIGAGVMGAGIAHWLSSRGLRVTLQDISAEALATGLGRIEKLYRAAVDRRILTRHEAERGLDRVVPALGPIPLRRMDLVIEAATEELEIKRRIFRDLADRIGTRTVVATNTSALPLRQLGLTLPLPGRLVGLHFFNPVHRMKLVEVVRGELTETEALATAVRLVQRIGKLPVVVSDSPGFLVNRILMPYLLEAATLFHNGGDPVAIDRSILQFGMPMGPLRLLDEVGLDVALHVTKTLSRAFPDRLPVPPLLVSMIREGLLGKKAGAGFFLYDEQGPRPNPAALELRGPVTALPDGLGFQLARRMVAEARRCLEEGVAESADDVDLAMILGTGFPPFRGGPLTFGRDCGLLRPRRTGLAPPTDINGLTSSPATL